MTTTVNLPPPATFADLPGLMSLLTGDDKHDQAATSTLDVLWVLYDRVLRVTPQTAGEDARDRFLLSKGHGPMAYYAVLAAGGFVDHGDLPGFGAFGSALGLQFHPEATPDVVRRWCVGGLEELARRGVDPVAFFSEADEQLEQSRARAELIVESFLSGALTTHVTT